MSYGAPTSDADLHQDASRGFYVPEVFRRSKARPSSTDAQRIQEISGMSTFRAWEGFDTETANAWRVASKYLGETCSNEMLDRRCVKEGCGRIADEKIELAKPLVRVFSREEAMYPSISNLLRALINILQMENPNWNVHLESQTAVVTGRGLNLGRRRSPVHLSADFGVINEDMDHNTPEALVEVKLPFYSLDIPDDTNEMVETRELPLYARYQAVFDRGFTRGDVYGFWIQNAICQTILEAMHTRTGRAALTTLREAVFVYVSGLTVDRRIDVQISDVFKFNGNFGILHGFLGFFRTIMLAFGTEDTIQRNLANIVLELSACYRKLSTTRNIRNLSGTPAGTAKIRNLSSTFGGAAGGAGRGKSDRNQRPCHGGTISSWEFLDKAENLGLAHRANEALERDLDFWLSRAEQSRLHSAMEKGNVLFLDKDLMSRAFMQSPRQFEILGCGFSGIAGKVVVNGLQVVVKYWNHRSKEGLSSLANEAGMYKYLLSLYPEVLGDAVPRVIAMCTDRAQDTVIVTEFVGEEIQRKHDGYYIAERKLSQPEVEAVSTAAAKSLRLLSECGIVHNDEDIRNLRVKWERNRTPQWHAWWIDLGNAFWIKSRPYDAMEVEEAVEEAVESALQWKL